MRKYKRALDITAWDGIKKVMLKRNDPQDIIFRVNGIVLIISCI